MSRLKAVLFVDIFPPSMGGGATRALCIARGLAALNCNVTVVTTSCNYPVGGSVLALKSSREQQDHIEVIRVPSLNLPFRGLLNRLLNYLSSSFFLLTVTPKLKKIDLIFSLGMHPFTDVAAYIVKLINPKSRFVIDISDVFPGKGIFRVGRAINKILLQLSDALIVLNERMKEFFKKLHKYSKKMEIIYNSVDTNVFRPNYSSKQKKRVLSTLCGRPLANSFIVCYFGVIGAFQCLDNILRVAAIIKESLNDVVFCIIGEGEEKTRLQQLASNLKNVFLLPKMPRHIIAQVAAETDLGLAPPGSDDPLIVYFCLPTKAAEFLSSGVPIFFFFCSFIGYIVSSWDAGYEVNFNSVEDLYNLLVHVYSHRNELTKKSVNARSLALRVFSFQAVQKTLTTLIQQ